MPIFFELQTPDEDHVLVNIDQITYIEKSSYGSIVNFVEGHVIVTQKPHELKRMIVKLGDNPSDNMFKESDS